ncbi:hypothetical protein OSB04_030984 [Centaurea solstitialis]|uniref:Uncharacterized protein n=1 Tax=Centaurea solstitialis TaxID=347529 RepID=A0AA38W7P0_9ASTR|nr:hypothetical protein OSB04_030984 [Centaurea solstitialis]
MTREKPLDRGKNLRSTKEDVLEIGVSIGDLEWSATASCDGVKREAVEKAVAKVMGWEEGARNEKAGSCA